MITYPRRHATPTWVKAALVVAAGWTYWRWLIAVCATVHFNDFGKFYYGIRAWLAGGSLYALSPASYIGDLPQPLTNLNPPHAMLLVWPVSLLPIVAAFAVWMFLNGAGMAWSAMLVARGTGWRPGFWPLVVLLMGAPTAGWLITGQLTGLLALPLALAWRHWRSGRELQGGRWFGLVLSVKPFLGLFLLWLIWRRDWRAVKGILIGSSAAVAAGMLVFGPYSYLEWAHSTAAVSWIWAPLNASVLGILTRAFGVTPYSEPMAAAPWLVNPLWAISVLSILVVLVRRLRSASIDDAWFLLMSAALLISPLGWVYYLWWLLPGLPRLLSSASAFLWLLPVLVIARVSFDHVSALGAVVLGSAYGWALIWAFFAAREACPANHCLERRPP